jgi:amino acid adenylation domain-containing protein
MTLLGAFQALLGRYAGVDDVVVGSAIANRTHVETEGLIGFFVNTLLLRADLAGNPPFTELLERVRTVALEAYAHQYLPFEKLVEDLAPERSLAHTPLFQVMFVLQNARIPELRLPDVTLRHVEVHNGTAKFDLILSLQERAEGLAGWLEYSTDLFDATTIERMSGHLGRFFEGVAADPGRRLWEVSLLREAERQQLTAEWNDVARDLVWDLAGEPRPASGLLLHDLFVAQAERNPAAVAVAVGGREISYLDLDRRAERLARSLQGFGVGVDARVGIAVRRSLEMVVAVLGTLKAGAACVPLDPTYPRDRLRLMVEDARLSALLTEEPLLTELPHCAAPALCLDSGLEEAEGGPAGRLSSGASPDNLAYVIYSSGSTGRPKGSALPHRALVNLILWQQQHAGLGRPARTLQFTSLSFDVSFQEIFSTWCSGGTLVLIEDEVRRDPEALLGFLVEQAIERLYLPFVALEALAEAAERTGKTPRHLREVITAGEQLRKTPALVRLFERLSPSALHNHYGPSETHVVTTCELPASPGSWSALPPIGRPVANTAIWLLDREGNPVPAGIPGELHIGGVALARGYLDRPDLTAEKFVPDAATGVPGGRLYRTGDLARFLGDGNIEFLGRSDHQVKVRGYRVELGEIESLLGAHPAVREAAVVVREPRPGDPRIVAYLVWDRERASASELRRYLEEQLPEYMLPRTFVSLERMPLTPSGKVDRRALPVPEGAETGAEKEYVAPRTQVEALLSEMWSQVLGVERVGLEDNFFDLGGHSLLATQMLSRIRNTFRVEVPLRRLFEKPTLGELARAVVEAEARPGQSEAIAGLLTQVKSLSGAELQRELVSRRAAGGER